MDYDSRALTWDDEKRIKRAKIISDEITDRIGIKDTHTALEFGCGTGLISFNLVEKFKKITLVDSSRGMIEVLNSKIEKYSIKNMSAYKMDIIDHNVLDEKYDVIYMSMVLHHIKDTAGIIRDLAGLLKENGCLCIVDLDEEDGSFHSEEEGFEGHNGFNQEELKDLLKWNGLRNMESSNFYTGKKRLGDRETEYTLFIMTGRK